MTKSRWLPFAGSVLCLLFTSAAFGQSNPRIGYVYPAGGRQGEKLDITIGGKDLTGEG